MQPELRVQPELPPLLREQQVLPEPREQPERVRPAWGRDAERQALPQTVPEYRALLRA